MDEYHQAWIGVPAPPLPELKDRIEGAQIKVSDYLGKRLLAIGLPSGNFVKSAPDKEALLKTMKVLLETRERAGESNFAVLAMTEDPDLFPTFWGDPTSTSALAGLAHYPVINLAGQWSFPEPYNTIWGEESPRNAHGPIGSLLIDRNGIIIRIYTESMTDKEIREAATIPDWSEKPRAVPKQMQNGS